MPVGNLLNMTASVWRPTYGRSSTSAALTAGPWAFKGDIRCTLQGKSSTNTIEYGANRFRNEYTLYADFTADLRPDDVIEFRRYTEGDVSPGTEGPDTESQYTYTIDAGPIDDAGHKAYLKFTVVRASSTG